MKNMKVIKKAAIALALTAAVSATCVFAGCSILSGKTVTAVSQSDSGITVTYSDGTTEEITISKGADGKDGESLTAQDLWETYKEIYNSDMSYEDFLTKFLGEVTSDLTNATKSVSTMLRSCFKVYANHHEVISSSRDRWTGQIKTVEGEVPYTGGAFIYKMDDNYTYLVTNYHVVYDSSAADNDSFAVSNNNNISNEIYLYMYGSESAPTYSDSKYTYTFDGNYVKASYIGGSIDHDIAVLRVATSEVKKLNSCAQAVEIADGYRVGETVYAIGNPQSEGISVTSGIVTVDSEYVALSIDDTSRYYRSLRTDAALDHGNSGGGLFNENGELIGVVNSGEVVTVITSSGSTESIPTSRGNAIPVSIATGVADCVIDSYTDTPVTPTRFLIGLTASAENSRYVYNSVTGYGQIEEDIKVTEVSSSSVAETIGLQANDYITALTINGTKHTLARRYEIGDLFLTIREGDKITISYKRGSTTAEEATSAEYTVTSSNLTSQFN